MTYRYGGRHDGRSVLLDDECIKCGSFDNKFRYHAYCEGYNFEHLHYACFPCGYNWTGETMDQIRSETGYFGESVEYAMNTDWGAWTSDEDYEDDYEYEPSLSRSY